MKRQKDKKDKKKEDRNMGLFDSIFKNNSSASSSATQRANPNPAANPYKGVLNLNKGDVLNLTKVDETLKNIRVAAGWDVNKNRHFGESDYDLDLCAYLINKNNRCTDIVYFGKKKHQGIKLDGDNLTGAGDGDDENIYTNLNKLSNDIASVVFAVVIYQAKSRKQCLGDVKNAYVRLVNEDNGYEVCRYNLSENGGDHSAVIAAKLYKNGGEWKFQPIEEYHDGDIKSLVDDVTRV